MRSSGDVQFADHLQASADAFGVSSTGSLNESFADIGSVLWQGSLLGVDVRQAMLPPVFGNAELEIDLETLTGQARFSNLVVAINEERQTFRQSTLQYDVTIDQNNFSGTFIEGGFYGPEHQEMAGILNDTDIDLLAGFGGVLE